MPGLVVTGSGRAGAGGGCRGGLVVLEAMKMENELKARRAGVVAVPRQPGQAVEKGQVLVGSPVEGVKPVSDRASLDLRLCPAILQVCSR